MVSPVELRLNKIIQNVIEPSLNVYSFKKNRDVYVHDRKELSWLIDIQRSRWNDIAKTEFTLNGGVFVPRVISIYINKLEPKKISLKDCCIHARIGMLADDKLDKWWTLTSGDDIVVDDAIGNDIKRRIECNIMPFLERLETLDDVIEFLKGPRQNEDRYVWPQSDAICLAYVAIIYSILGEFKKSEAAFDSAVKAAQNSPVESVIIKLRNRILKRPV